MPYFMIEWFVLLLCNGDIPPSPHSHLGLENDCSHSAFLEFCIKNEIQHRLSLGPLRYHTIKSTWWLETSNEK